MKENFYCYYTELIETPKEYTKYLKNGVNCRLVIKKEGIQIELNEKEIEKLAKSIPKYYINK